MAKELVPIGTTATDPRPGDFILCHRKGLASKLIRAGEYVHERQGAVVSHAAFIETPTTLIEALTRGVVRTPLEDYQDIEYWIMRTGLPPLDRYQAVAFAQSCVGQKYGFVVIFGVALRYLTWGEGLWFGMNGTEICSGLVGQTQVRSWANYPVNPATITPAGLWRYYS